MHSHFGYSIGGSIASRPDSSNDQEAIQILTSAFKIEKEPTKQRDEEREIQENMANLFETEADKGPVDAENDPKTDDEKYAMKEFKKNLTFERRMYWAKPIFKKTAD